ncbi:MAG: nucleotidyltransferase domain-containing protein [Defluviitaleaceae bacterium]|nr:nucleotidyltransferase domain-containing protein [Defluviitaleaceae bacterium]MCL2264020.1 nucleotidyltransferase domain-containing protein [Defluviitaleaceae bacterium]
MNVQDLCRSLIDNIVAAARGDESIRAVYIFGSHVRGEATIFSDVDIAVIHEENPDVNRAALNEATARHDEDVQFTYVHKAVFDSDDHPLHVSSSIKREGVLLWQR